MNWFKKREIAREKEIDRIIKEGADTLDLDYYRWIICWLMKKNSLKRLKKCNLKTWKEDLEVWNNMRKLVINL